MRVFVTGASGHIGSALVPELLAAGHDVVGLARSDAAAAALMAAGATVQRGDLDDLDGLHEAAAAADGVIHLAFKHDVAFTGDFAGAAAADLRAIEAMGRALDGSAKPFVGTSGTMLLVAAAPGRLGTEQDAAEQGPRIDSENTVIALSRRGVRSSVIRLAPTVHSSLDHHGFVPSLIAMARKNGYAGYVGDGSNRWPAVHTLDAARLYRLALEAAPGGSRLHGAAEEGVLFRDIADAIGRGIGQRVVSVTAGDAGQCFGFLAPFVQRDNPTSSSHTQKLLGWQPGCWPTSLSATTSSRHNPPLQMPGEHDEGRIRADHELMPWLPYALLSAAAAALTAVFGKLGVTGIPSTLATAIRTVIIAVFAWAMVLGLREHRALSTVPRSAWTFLALSGLATGVSWLAYYRALQLGPASRVAPIDKLSLPITIVLAVLFLGERVTVKAAVGVALMVAGAMLTL